MLSCLDKRKAWSQLELRVNQCNGALDSKMKNLFCYLVQDAMIGTHHYGLQCAISAQTFVRVLQMCLPKLHSRDRILNY
jgi:hypothetical protein